MKTPPQSMFKNAHRSRDGAPSPTTSNAKTSSGRNSLYRSLVIASVSAVLCISTLAVYHGKHDTNDLRSTHRRLARSRYNNRFVAWFLTYPGAGTTHVMNIIQKVSGRSTASNYGGIMMGTDGSIYTSEKNRSIFRNGRGPQYNTELPIPDKYVLTSSYGHGTCVSCPPSDYMGHLAKVLRKHYLANSAVTLTTTDGDTVRERYPSSTVGKTLVMVRSPLDIAVIRFISQLNRNDDKSESEPTREKFDKYCSDQDSDEELLPLEKVAYSHAQFWDEAAGVKCHAEFVKLFLFYNYVVEMLNKWDHLKDNSMFVHFDDFSAGRVEETLDEVLSFLELPNENPVPDTVIKSEGTMFWDFFSEEEKQAIAKLCKKISLPTIWTLFEPYLGEYLL